MGGGEKIFPRGSPEDFIALLRAVGYKDRRQRMIDESLEPAQIPDEIADALDRQETLGVRLRALEEGVRLAVAESELQQRARVKEVADRVIGERDPKPAQTETRRRAGSRVRALHLAGVIERIYEVQRGLCAYCKSALGRAFHVDHILPISRGGRTEEENLCCACPTCNHRKHAKTGDEFRALLAKA